MEVLQSFRAVHIIAYPRYNLIVADDVYLEAQ